MVNEHRRCKSGIVRSHPGPVSPPKKSSEKSYQVAGFVTKKLAVRARPLSPTL